MSDSPTPRDVKILHLILASMGVSAFQDHVPLMLMDFAFRYTQGALRDALAYSDYAGSNAPSSVAGSSGAGGPAAGSQPAGMTPMATPLTVDDIRLAVSARVQYQFKPTAPKELLLELAQERNKRPLPPVPQAYGLRLPPEKYCLTGREREIDEDDDIVIPGYEPVSLGDVDDTYPDLAIDPLPSEAGEADEDGSESKESKPESEVMIPDQESKHESKEGSRESSQGPGVGANGPQEAIESQQGADDQMDTS